MDALEKRFHAVKTMILDAAMGTHRRSLAHEGMSGMVGGCCGTTPAPIRELARVFQDDVSSGGKV